jgi:hypothetical protein
LIRKVPAAGASLSERLKAHWGDTSPFDAKVILLEELKTDVPPAENELTR